MLRKLKKFFSGKKFIYVVLLLFLAQGIYFASAIRYEIPPDERTHFQLTNYYAEQPILHGPFITSQYDHFKLGDIQRTTSYLYHYLMNFPLRVVKHISSDISTQVFILRIINVLLGVAAIFILFKLFNKLKVPDLVSNLSLLALVLTGMFVWIFAAINYDNLAMPLFFLLVYFAVSFVQHKKFTTLLWVTFLSMALVLTKVTYAPTVLFIYLAGLFLLRQDAGAVLKTRRLNIKINKTRPLMVFLIVANLIFLGLCIERFGVNIVKYHAVSPSCSKVHTYNECLQLPTFARSVKQAAKFKAEGSAVPFTPIEFAGSWIEQMYERIYFYFGHKYILPNNAAKALMGVTLAAILIFFIFRPAKLVTTRELGLLASVAAFYVLLLFFFNMHSYLSTGAQFGFQGRYLLPVVPFIYLFIVLAIRNFYLKSSLSMKTATVWVVGILALANLYVHTPILVFLRGTDATWYTGKTASFNNGLKDVARDTKLLHWTLPHGQ